MSTTSRQLEAAGSLIAINIFVQVFSRAFTFLLRAITLKYLQSTALLGIINVRLALLYTTIQFLSREPFRKAVIGEVAKSNSGRLKRINNTIWLGFLLSIALSIPLSYIWILNSPPVEDLVGTRLGDYYAAVLIICLSVIVEMTAEPCFIYAQAKALSKHNPTVEITSVTLSCVLTAAVTVFESTRDQSGQSTYILTKIALCQLIASFSSVVHSYTRLCSEQGLSFRDFLPTIQSAKQNSLIDKNFDKISIKLSSSFVLQTFLKQLLTEGERYIMTFFNVISLSEQGIYDVINNLGSLAARLVFKPIEDSGYTLFSQTVSRTEILDIRKFYQVQENLMYLIKSMLLVAFIVLIFGYNFVPLIVLYGGEKLNNQVAFGLMRWQLFYTPLLAVNGITECFTFATMNTSEIRTYNYSMILFSFIYLLSIYFTQSTCGSASFILANCIIMFCRILSSLRQISDYFDKHAYQFRIQDSFPSLTTMISLFGVFFFLSISQNYLLDLSQPLSVVFGIILGGWSFIFIIHVIVCHEKDLLGCGPACQ